MKVHILVSVENGVAVLVKSFASAQEALKYEEEQKAAYLQDTVLLWETFSEAHAIDLSVWETEIGDAS